MPGFRGSLRLLFNIDKRETQLFCDSHDIVDPTRVVCKVCDMKRLS